jgi:hypothetical protein
MSPSPSTYWLLYNRDKRVPMTAFIISNNFFAC